MRPLFHTIHHALFSIAGGVYEMLDAMVIPSSTWCSLQNARLLNAGYIVLDVLPNLMVCSIRASTVG
jgi:hypothetical protein